MHCHAKTLHRGSMHEQHANCHELLLALGERTGARGSKRGRPAVTPRAGAQREGAAFTCATLSRSWRARPSFRGVGNVSVGLVEATCLAIQTLHEKLKETPPKKLP